VFSDPQSVTYATVAKSLPKIGSDANQSTYKLNDGTAVYTLSLSHQFKTRNRVVARLQRDSYSADPLVPANSIAASMTVTLTADFPNVGLLPADVQNLINAMTGYMSSANALKLVNGET
jgi:hypothetical protein